MNKIKGLKIVKLKGRMLNKPLEGGMCGGGEKWPARRMEWGWAWMMYLIQ